MLCNGRIEMSSFFAVASKANRDQLINWSVRLVPQCTATVLPLSPLMEIKPHVIADKRKAEHFKDKSLSIALGMTVERATNMT